MTIEPTESLLPFHDAMHNAQTKEAIRQARSRDKLVEYSNLDELKNNYDES